MTIVEFLLTRYDEDEEWANATGSPDYDEPHEVGAPGHHDRVLAECEAKRRIVLMDESFDDAYVTATHALASIYADHPDYDEAWRP